MKLRNLFRHFSLINMLLLLSLPAQASDLWQQELDKAVADSDAIRTALRTQVIRGILADGELASLANDLADTSATVARLATTTLAPITDPAIYNAALDSFAVLSNNSVAIARDLVQLADANSARASNTYLETLRVMTQTTLRLSDDIGKMADRILFTEEQIGLMADRIGEMADRIVETQRIQNENIRLVANLANRILTGLERQSTPAATVARPPAMTTRPSRPMGRF